MSDFPKMLYHPTKPDFFCPSEEFLKTLEGWKEYETLPFTGPRKVEEETKCKGCMELKIKLADLQLSLEATELEVKRVRAALDIAKKEVKSVKALKNPVGV